MQKRININEAKASMTLATDVTDTKGKILAKADIKLTDKLITSLEKRGCSHLMIEVQNIISQAEYDQLLKSLTKRFENIAKPNWLFQLQTELICHYNSLL